MPALRWIIPVVVCIQAACFCPAAEPDGASLNLPHPGDLQLRCLAPRLLEVTLITTQPKSPGPQWDFVGEDGHLHLPDAKEFVVTVGGSNCPVSAIGFKRRVVYAPLKQHDIRIGNFLYLELANSITNGQRVELKNPDAHLWPASQTLSVVCAPTRWSPAIHADQVGYLPELPKKAMVGFYLGNLGEMDLSQCSPQASNTFQLIDAATGHSVYQGTLTPRPDRGFPFENYQRVLEADFSAFKTPGEYRVLVPGLGASYPFFISDDIAGAFARTYALGLYHQRCGTSNALPFTRFTHDACHTAPAQIPVPQSEFKFTWDTIAQTDSDFASEPRHTAPQLKGEASQLYPFVKRGPVNVTRGHHDAGDYSKYTINSAGLIHFLVFAADVFPGAAALDNLGLPESGDGRSDLLEEAKWEADFLAQMQDDDGGFYFLVYPREREYEIDVLPDHGDPQVVWPKNTAASAAATAALAECASSPLFKKQFPEAAELYLKKARAGWAFLERAIAAHGRDGAYQKLSHYGDDFMHDDELAWAACEMYLATGDEAIHQKLLDWLKIPETRKWGWWRLYSSYGCAIRSYAFAARSGRVKREKLDQILLSGCEDEIIAAAQDQLRRSEDCAYGTSLPEETKRSRSAGWYFSGDAAFDLAVACQLDYPIFNDPRPKFLKAIISNLNYEAGCNPVNICYLTGLGWKRPHEIVHQYAQNQRRMLPPDGIPIGNVQGGYSWIGQYQNELSKLSFPSDGDETAPYAFYDRWADTFNLNTEFVVLNQARGLAYTAWLMARTPLKDQPWRSGEAHIAFSPGAKASSSGRTATLETPGMDLQQARIIWEMRDHEPVWGKTVQVPTVKSSPLWIEAEAQLPDGRRLFAVTNLTSQPFWKFANP